MAESIVAGRASSPGARIPQSNQCGTQSGHSELDRRSQARRLQRGRTGGANRPDPCAAKWGSLTATREAIGTGEATLEVAVTVGRRVRDILLKLRDKAAEGSDPKLVNDFKTMVLADFETVSNDLDRVAGDEEFAGANVNLDGATRTKLSDDPDTLIKKLRNIADDANYSGISVTLDAEARTKLSSEFDSLLAELKDVVNEADFNGINLVAAGGRDIENHHRSEGQRDLGRSPGPERRRT